MNQCQRCPAFNSCFASKLNEKELSDLGTKIKMVMLKPNERIFREFHLATTIFMILEGSVLFEKEYHLDRPIIIRKVREREFIGLEAVLPRKEYYSNATTCEETTLCAIPVDHVEKLFQENKSACNKILMEVQDAIDRLLRYSLLLISASSESKLAFALKTLSNKNLIVDASKEEIALMTGLTRETISRLLGNMKKMGVVDVQTRKVKILHMESINKLINKVKHKD